MSRNIIMLLEAVYFFVMICLAHSTLLQSPEDTVAVVGDTVILKCRTDVNSTTNPVEWRYKKVHTDSVEFVYKFNRVFRDKCDRCDVVPNRAAGQYDLIIRNVQPSDSGRYTCGDKDDSHHAELVVLPITTATSLSYGECDQKTINCSDGNSLQCKYTWKDENGTEVSHSSSMEMAGKLNGNYTCLATCKVLQTSYVAKIFNYRCDDYSTGQLTSTTSSSTTSSSTTSSPEAIGSPEPIISSPGMTSPEIYIPVSIISFVIFISIIVLVVRVFRRSRCVSERTNDNHNENDVEFGESNTTEMTTLNGTKSQETDVMLTTNTQGS